jgi:hypothetical protein
LHSSFTLRGDKVETYMVAEVSKKAQQSLKLELLDLKYKLGKRRTPSNPRTQTE